MSNTAYVSSYENVANCLEATRVMLEMTKPGDRGNFDRRYAVTITELEKVIAYFDKYVVGPRNKLRHETQNLPDVQKANEGGDVPQLCEGERLH